MVQQEYALKANPGSPEEREKARRGWMAVLAELKGAGQMKLYTLLAKARVVSVADGELELGFGADAAFQMEALKDSGDLVKVEETWERFLGNPVKVKLSMLGGRAGDSGSTPVAEQGSEQVTKPKAGQEKTGAEAPKKHEEEEAAARPEKEAEPDTVGSPTQSKSSAEVARMLEERFDGEIVETKEGKD
jgi:hypothetical protein